MPWRGAVKAPGDSAQWGGSAGRTDCRRLALPAQGGWLELGGARRAARKLPSPLRRRCVAGLTLSGSGRMRRPAPARLRGVGCPAVINGYRPFGWASRRGYGRWVSCLERVYALRRARFIPMFAVRHGAADIAPDASGGCAS